MPISVLHAQLNIPGVKVKGKEFPEGPHNITIIGVSSYPNEQLTFIIQGEGGWVYTYVPAHYLTLEKTWIEQDRKFLCPGIEFVITKPIISQATFVEGPVKLLFSIDWLDKNELLHCGTLINGGGLLIYPHRKFVSVNPPKLEKMRGTWK